MPNADSSLNYRDPMEFISPASIFYDLELFFSLSLVLLVEFYFGDIVENSPLLEIKFFFFSSFSLLSQLINSVRVKRTDGLLSFQCTLELLARAFPPIDLHAVKWFNDSPQQKGEKRKVGKNLDKRWVRSNLPHHLSIGQLNVVLGADTLMQMRRGPGNDV